MKMMMNMEEWGGTGPLGRIREAIFGIAMIRTRFISYFNCFIIYTSTISEMHWYKGMQLHACTQFVWYRTIQRMTGTNECKDMRDFLICFSPCFIFLNLSHSYFISCCIFKSMFYSEIRVQIRVGAGFVELLQILQFIPKQQFGRNQKWQRWWKQKRQGQIKVQMQCTKLGGYEWIHSYYLYGGVGSTNNNVV